MRQRVLTGDAVQVHILDQKEHHLKVQVEGEILHLSLDDFHNCLPRKPLVGDVVSVLSGVSPFVRESGVLAVKEIVDDKAVLVDPQGSIFRRDLSQLVVHKHGSHQTYGLPSFESLVPRSKAGFLVRPKTNKIRVSSKRQMDWLRNKLKEEFQSGNIYVAIDTETTGLVMDVLKDKERSIIGICLSVNPDEGFYLPVVYQDDWLICRDLLKELAETRVCIFHNATFDLIALSQWDLTFPQFHDTQIISKLVNDNRMNHKLKVLAEEVLGREDVIHYKDVAKADMTLVGVDLHVATEYAAADAANTYALFKHLIPELNKIPTLLDYYEDVELQAITRIAVPIALNGLKVDRTVVEDIHQGLQAEVKELSDKVQESLKPYLKKLRQQYEEKLLDVWERIEEEVKIRYLEKEKDLTLKFLQDMPIKLRNLDQAMKMLGRMQKKAFKSIASYQNMLDKAKAADPIEVNLNSRDQLKVLVHKFWKLPIIKKTKAGNSSIGKATFYEFTLEAQKRKLHDAVKFFENYGSLVKATKLVQAFTSPTLNLLDKYQTDMIHPDFVSLGARTSRSACRNPNLQQLPAKSKWDFRKAFIPDSDDHVFVDADLCVIGHLKGNLHD